MDRRTEFIFLHPSTPQVSPLVHDPGDRIKMPSYMFFYFSFVRTHTKLGIKIFIIDLSPPVKYFTEGSKAVLFLCIFYVFVLSCVCYVFARVCLYVFCGHLLGKG